MKSAIAILACAAFATAAPTSLSALREYKFEQFLKDFRFEWKEGTEEFNLRKSLFEKELQRVIAHNQNEKSLWKEGINKFSAYTASEQKSFNGRSKGVAREHKPKHLKDFHLDLKPVSELPSSVDWRQEGVVTAVKDQGGCGSCWAFAATETLESHLALSSGLLYDLSLQQVAMCSPNPDSCGGTGGCQGATAEIAFDYVAGAGILEEYQYGYVSYYGQNFDCEPRGQGVATIDGYVQLPENNYTALMNAIATVGPVSVSVDASSWGAYSSGIFNGCVRENVDINHAVVAVGYGEEEDGQKYWIIRNSWAPSWGEKGYMKLARYDDDETNCHMDVTPQHGTACEGEDEPVKACGVCGVLYDSAYPTNVQTR